MAKTKIGSNTTFIAPNKGLSTIGGHAYCFSGAFGTSSTEFEMLNFTTGDYYLIGEFTFNGATRMDLVDVGSVSAFEVSLNGQVVSVCKQDTNDKDSPGQGFLKLLIPSNTKVIVSCIASEDTANEKLSVCFVGRIYA